MERQAWPPVPELAASVASGATTAARLVDEALARVRAVGTARAGYVAVMPDRARARAAAADRSLRDGRPPGPLAGVPLAVKDNIALGGHASHVWARFPPEPGGQSSLPGYLETDRPRRAVRDAPCVSRLEAAGAVVIGTTHMAEWAMGVTGANPFLPELSHPLDEARAPGGSSSGSAVAVALGTVPVALGTDTGGSVRIPAALCGLVGLRPGEGEASPAGVVPVSASFDRVGLLTSRARDARAVLAVLGRGAVPPGLPAWRPDRLRLGIVEEAFASIADEEVAGAFDLVLGMLAVSHELVPVGTTGWQAAAVATRSIVHAEAARYHRTRLDASAECFGPDVRARLEEGAALGTAAVAAARATVEAWKRQVQTALTGLDALVAPTCATVAPPWSSARLAPTTAALSEHAYAVSASGCPAVSVPCACTSSGLPLGCQLVGTPLAEDLLLAVAEVVEATLAVRCHPQHLLTTTNTVYKI